MKDEERTGGGAEERGVRRSEDETIDIKTNPRPYMSLVPHGEEPDTNCECPQCHSATPEVLLRNSLSKELPGASWGARSGRFAGPGQRLKYVEIPAIT